MDIPHGIATAAHHPIHVELEVHEGGIRAREQDIQHDFYRPISSAKFSAGFDAQGNPVAWTTRIAGHSIQDRMFPADSPPIAALLPVDYERMGEMVAGFSASSVTSAR